LIATVLIGAPAVQATIDMPCHMVVATGDRLSSAQVPDPMPAPCKGTMPGCADVLVCGLSAALPAHLTATSRKLIWTSAAYEAVADSREGLSVQPDLVPPHYDLTHQCSPRTETAATVRRLATGVVSAHRQSFRNTVNRHDPTAPRA
jgi:hypothetical protein